METLLNGHEYPRGHVGDGEVEGSTIVGLKDRMAELELYLKNSIQGLIGLWNMGRKVTG